MKTAALLDLERTTAVGIKLHKKAVNDVFFGLFLRLKRGHLA
jgi:hypothetical protein